MNVVYKLKDYSVTFPFEREHPKELRWDNKYKLYMLTEHETCQGMWFYEKSVLFGEIITSWQSANVLHIDSFTVLPSHRGKGLGYEMISSLMDWAKEMDHEYITGEARQGASWHIFQNLGAEPVLLHKDWNKTKENYMSFKITL